MLKEEDAAELKALKDYALVKGELYTKRLRPSEGRIVPQDARWSFVQMCGMGGSLEKIERCT